MNNPTKERKEKNLFRLEKKTLVTRTNNKKYNQFFPVLKNV